MTNTKALPGDLDAEIRARASQEPSLRGFAYCVARLEDLGVALGTALASYLEQGEFPQRVVVLPRQRLLLRGYRDRSWLSFPIWKHTPEVILLQTTRRLLSAAIIEGRRLEVSFTPLDHLITFQLGTVLLFSWFEWSWASDGNLETRRVYFNTVSDYIFRELQQCLSSMFVQLGGMNTIPYTQGLHHLDDLPYKFRNIIPVRLLLPQEDIQAVVYRPGLWEHRLVFLRRQISPTAALVLTDGQVLVAEEDLVGAEGHYGVIARYMSRHSFNRVVLDEKQGGIHLSMVFRVRGVEFEQCMRFGTSAKPQLDQLLSLLTHHEVFPQP